MQLDAAVESALNVLPSNTDAASSFSLYGLLNKACTPMGKALLKVTPSPRERRHPPRFAPSGRACCLPQCRRALVCLQTWLKQPLTDLEAIQGRHDVVEALLGDAQLRADLRGLHLRGVSLAAGGQPGEGGSPGLCPLRADLPTKVSLGTAAQLPALTARWRCANTRRPT